MPEKRQDWIDIVKGFAIILVVLGHINYSYPSISIFPVPYIYSWHIRVFFLVAGFFLLTEKLEKPIPFIKGKFKSLYLPLLYIYVPATLLHNVLFDIGWYSTDIEYGGRLIREWWWEDYAIGLAKTLLFMGSEPIVGALWFAYVLFLCMLVISLTSWSAKRLMQNDVKRREHFVMIVLLLLALFQSIASTHFNLSIPRLHLVLTYSWMIYCGKIIVNKFNVQFDNTFCFVLCAIGLYSISVMRVIVQMDEGSTEIVSLTVSSFFALYVLAYIAKKCRGWLAKVLSLIGRESFYIMGLHFVAFKICVYSLGLCGMHQNISELTPTCSNMVVLLFYLLGGVMLSVGFILLWRKAISTL